MFEGLATSNSYAATPMCETMYDVIVNWEDSFFQRPNACDPGNC
jgi:hypothetical protein